jgi:hypothetical protein
VENHRHSGALCGSDALVFKVAAGAMIVQLVIFTVALLLWLVLLALGITTLAL